MGQSRILENYKYIVSEIKQLGHTCKSDKEFKEGAIKLVNLATTKDVLEVSQNKI